MRGTSTRKSTRNRRNYDTADKTGLGINRLLEGYHRGVGGPRHTSPLENGSVATDDFYHRGVGGPRHTSPLENGSVPICGFHRRGVCGPSPSSPLENGSVPMNGFHHRGVCGPYPFSFLEQQNTRRPSFEERRVVRQLSRLIIASSILSFASRSALRHSDFAVAAAAKWIDIRCVAST